MGGRGCCCVRSSRLNVFDIIKHVNRFDNISYSFSFLDSVASQMLSDMLTVILGKYNQEQYYSVLRGCLKELVVNAVKANAKKIFFDESLLDREDPRQYTSGLESFRKLFSPDWLEEYSAKAAQLGIQVQVVFNFLEDGMRFEVINQVPLCAEDEKIIRPRLADGMRAVDIVKFFGEHASTFEGAGLGFAMCLILLRGENLDPSLMRIGNIGGATVARVEVPFTEKYISVRRRG